MVICIVRYTPSMFIRDGTLSFTRDEGWEICLELFFGVGSQSRRSTIGSRVLRRLGDSCHRSDFRAAVTHVSWGCVRVGWQPCVGSLMRYFMEF